MKDLFLNDALASSYSSQAQKIRVMTECWVRENIFCSACGSSIEEYPNNAPVADFFCNQCDEDYELKSKCGKPTSKIVDGAYSTMIERLKSSTNPNLFFLNYNKNLEVKDFFIIPKSFFVPNIIEKRKPLSEKARRAGWVGCNILINKIPKRAKIFYVKNSIQLNKSEVINEWNKLSFISNMKNDSSKGWIFDIIMCIEKIDKKIFSLQEMYSFEADLSLKYRNNKHIKDKIRQQLQVLRDKGYLEFVSKGLYRVL